MDFEKKREGQGRDLCNNDKLCQAGRRQANSNGRDGVLVGAWSNCSGNSMSAHHHGLVAEKFRRYENNTGTAHVAHSVERLKRPVTGPRCGNSLRPNKQRIIEKIHWEGKHLTENT